MRIFTLAVSVCAGGLLLHADTAQERLRDSTAVLTEIMNTPDKGIPQDLLEKARCVVVMPGVKSGGFIIGAKYGRGFARRQQRLGRSGGVPRRGRQFRLSDRRSEHRRGNAGDERARNAAPSGG
jgi:hypothetical protein